MLLCDDVVGDRQASPVPSPGRLVVKNYWNSLSLMSAGDAGAVVPHSDFHQIADVAGGDRRARREVAALAAGRARHVVGVEAMLNKV